MGGPDLPRWQGALPRPLRRRGGSRREAHSHVRECATVYFGSGTPVHSLLTEDQLSHPSPRSDRLTGVHAEATLQIQQGTFERWLADRRSEKAAAQVSFA